MKSVKGAVKNIIRRLGFEVRQIPPAVASSLDGGHELVSPGATYSPWNRDPLFQAALKSIRGFSLVDKYRCFELWKLVEESAKLEKGSIIEIGVWRGGTGALMAAQAKNCGIRDKVFLCDTFEGVVKTGQSDSHYQDGEHSDTSRQTVEDLVFSKMKLDNVEILEGIFPDQTGHRVENLAFRFCHIDVDVYQSAKDIVDWIWDKMVRGGIIVYDDYGFSRCDGITKYVEEQRGCGDRLVIHNLNGHAIVVKL
jgi:O-methyltransferase